MLLRNQKKDYNLHHLNLIYDKFLNHLHSLQVQVDIYSSQMLFYLLTFLVLIKKGIYVKFYLEKEFISLE